MFKRLLLIAVLVVTIGGTLASCNFSYRPSASPIKFVYDVYQNRFKLAMDYAFITPVGEFSLEADFSDQIPPDGFTVILQNKEKSFSNDVYYVPYGAGETIKIVVYGETEIEITPDENQAVIDVTKGDISSIDIIFKEEPDFWTKFLVEMWNKSGYRPFGLFQGILNAANESTNEPYIAVYIPGWLVGALMYILSPIVFILDVFLTFFFGIGVLLSYIHAVFMYLFYAVVGVFVLFYAARFFLSTS